MMVTNQIARLQIDRFDGQLDPQVWLEDIEHESELIGWDKTKLLKEFKFYLVGPPRVDWYEYLEKETKNDWKLLRTIFLQRFAMKTDWTSAFKAYKTLQQQPNQSIKEFVEEFKLYKTRYEYAKNTDRVSRDLKGDFKIDSDELLTDFIKAIRADLREVQRIHPISSIEEAEQILKDVEGFEHRCAVPKLEKNKLDSEEQIKNVKILEKKEEKKLEKGDMNDLIERMNRLELNLFRMSGQPVPLEKPPPMCYNCRQMGHFSRDCTQPCSYCQSSNHKNNQCPQRPPPRPRPVIPTLKEAMLTENEGVEEILQAEKRAYANGSGKATNKKARVETVNKLSEENPMSINNIIHSEPLRQKTIARKEPRLINALKDATSALTADFILNNARVEVSVAQLAQASPNLRIELRKAIQTNLTDTKKNIKDQLLGENKRFNGKIPGGAPRTPVKVGEYTVYAILDGGAVGNIISQQLVKLLGNIDIYQPEHSYRMADGRATASSGEVKNLKVWIGDRSYSVDASVYPDVRYPLLLGRQVMEDLGIVTDWGSKRWIITKAKTYVPLDIIYDSAFRVLGNVTKNKIKYEDEEGNEEEEENEDGEEEEENRLDNLILSEEDEKEIREDELAAACPENAELYLTEPIITRLSADGNLNKQELQVVKDEVVPYLNKVIAPTLSELKAAKIGLFHIDLKPNAKLVKIPIRPTPHAYRQFTEEWIQQGLAAGILQPSISPWRSLLVYVEKKDGSTRPCINYRAINLQTIDNAYRIPRIDEVIDLLAGKAFISEFDFFSGYYQLRVDENTIPLTAFRCEYGSFEFTCMPFGFSTAPACFQQAMDDLVGLHRFSFARAYFDNLLIASSTFSDHIRHLVDILHTIEQNGFSLNAKKSSIFATELTTLGFIIDGRGSRVDPVKYKAIIGFPQPASVHDIRSFLGLVGFCSKFINNFATIVWPLTERLKKGVKFEWNEIEESAFVRLKKCFEKTSLLRHFDPKRATKVYFDANNKAIGMVLTQVYDEMDEPVLFWSRKLTNTEQRYPVHEREFLAIVDGIKRHRHYLLGILFIVYTDNSAVTYLAEKLDVNARIARWIITLSEFRIIFKHIAGRKNVLADTLTRYLPLAEEEIEEIDNMNELYLSDRLDIATLDLEEELQQIIRNVYLFEWNNSQTYIQRQHIIQTYRWTNGQLKRLRPSGWVVIPFKKERLSILKELHDGMGYFGRDSTWDRLQNLYWWPKVYENTVDYIKSCKPCQIYMKNTIKYPARPMEPFDLFDNWHLDYIGPFPRSEDEKQFIILAIDYFSRFAVAGVTKQATVAVTAMFIYEEIFCRFGPPKRITSDRGTHFIAETVAAFVEIAQTKHYFTTPYNPQSNAVDERANQMLVRALARCVNEQKEKWSYFVPTVIWAYNTKIHRLLGIEPYTIVFGRRARPDLYQRMGESIGAIRLQEMRDDREEVEEMYRMRYKSLKDFFEKEVQKLPRYSVGDYVLIRNPRQGKLIPSWRGPYQITAITENNIVKLEDLQGQPLKTMVNLRRIKFFIGQVLGGERVT